jgi:hypothetical protein
VATVLLRRGFTAKELTFIGAAALVCASAAGASAGPLSIMLVPFAAALALAVTAQAIAWLALLVLLSGVSLYWSEASVRLAGNNINLSGLQWGSTFLLAGGLLLFLPGHGRRIPRFFIAYGAFVALAVAGVLVAGNRFEAIKQAMLYATPLVVALLVLRVARGERDVATLRNALWGALIISAVVGVASVAWSELSGITGGLRGALGNRTFAIFLVVPYALALGAWRTRSPEYLLVALGVLVLIGLTLSRTVMAVSLLMFAAAAAVGASPMRKLAGVVVIVALGLLAWQVDALRGRMLNEQMRGEALSVSLTGEGRERQITLGPVDLTGRGVYWFQTAMHGLQSPVIGHGTGSATVYLRDELQFPIAHPHNDYLRVFHDSGVVGVATVVAFAVMGLTFSFRLYRRAASVLGREVALAAWLAFGAYLLIAVTDNVMIYASFFTVNVFLLFGMAAVCEGIVSGTGRGPGPGSQPGPGVS